ncbi:MAG TPA: response regulator, partial [Hyphomicrobiales bacterium]|nr:response regulator [Hyphomicrobiales bacterium]
CLFGNLKLGDIVVAEAIESLNPAGGCDLRLELYRKVNSAAQGSSFCGKVSATVASGVYGRFWRLPPEMRQICALHNMIGLTYAEVAAIMAIPETQVRKTYLEGLDVLKRAEMTVLIIEDDPLIARDLYEIIGNLGLSVAGTAKNKEEALHIAAVVKPRIILVDYKLDGDTGVDVVKAIRQDIDADVIYVTAFPEKVIVDRENPRDLIIPKPFSVRSVELAVQLYLAA